TGHTQPVTAVRFLPDGKTLLSHSLRGAVRVWETATGKFLRSFGNPGIGVRSVGPVGPALSGDGTTLFTRGPDGTIRQWEVSTGNPVRQLATNLGRVGALALSRDAKFLAWAHPDGTVRLWDAALAREVRTLPRKGGTFTALAFTPDGKTLAVGGTGGNAGSGVTL